MITITNISNIKNDSLIAAQNQLPLTLVVDSQSLPVVTISVSSGGNYIAQNLEMINYQTRSPFFYFTIDIKDIVCTLFDNLDDSLQSAWNWQTMVDSMYDIDIVVTATNIGGESANLSIGFTVVNIAKQFGNSSTICESPDELYDLDQDEYIYAGADNLGYAYVISKAEDDVSTSIERRNYFIDSDDFLFTVEDDEKMTYEE